VVKPEGKRKRPLGRPRRRLVDNIRMGLGEVGWGDVAWIGLAKDRNRWRALVNSVLNLLVPRNAGKLSSGRASSGISSSAQLHRVSYLVMSITVINLKLYCNLVLFCTKAIRKKSFEENIVLHLCCGSA
jgi:hypothetical protein